MRPLKPPGLQALRDAVRFVFEPGRWTFFINGTPPRLFVHGDPEFEAYREHTVFTTAPDRARQGVVLAVVAMAQRVQPLILGARIGGIKNLELRKEEAFREQRTKFRSRLNQAIKASGYEGVQALARAPRRRLVKTLTSVSPGAEIGNPSDRNSLDDLLDGIELPPGSEKVANLVLRELRQEEDIPRNQGSNPSRRSPPQLPDASQAELLKAIKYVLVGPLTVRVIQRADPKQPLAVSHNAAARPFLNGSRIASEADKARSAVAMAFKHLVESTSSAEATAVSPTGSVGARCEAMRSQIRANLESAVLAEGIAGIRNLCAGKSPSRTI